MNEVGTFFLSCVILVHWQVSLTASTTPNSSSTGTLSLWNYFWLLVSQQGFSVVIKSFLGCLSSQEMRQKLISSRCCLLRTKESMCPFWKPQVTEKGVNHVYVMWEARWPHGECAGLWSERCGFEPWELWVVFLVETHYSHAQMSNFFPLFFLGWGGGGCNL